MIRNRIRQRATHCLVVVSALFLLASAAHAHNAPKADDSSKRVAVYTDIHLFEKNTGLLLAQNKKGLGKLSRKGEAQVQEWDRMTPEEKARYQRRYQQLQQMSPKERKRYEKWHQQWKKLSPRERDQIRNKLKRSDELSPQEVDTIRRRFKN